MTWISRAKWNSGVALMTKYFLWVLINTLGLIANLWMLATLASQIPILAPASPPLGSGFFDLTPFDQKTGHSSLRVYQDPQKLILSYEKITPSKIPIKTVWPRNFSPSNVTKTHSILPLHQVDLVFVLNLCHMLVLCHQMVSYLHDKVLEFHNCLDH